MLRRAFVLSALVSVGMVSPSGAQAPASKAPAVTAASCQKIASLALSKTKISMTQLVPAGSFTPPGTVGGPAQPQPLTGLPEFCRVVASIHPTTDSDIRIEVWLPTTGWNGKFMAVGNGVWRGAIQHAAMAGMLTRGDATASTDTGHEGAGGDASFAMGHPEKLNDFGHRAVHEMTLKSKAVVAALYGTGPRYSYWSGCSSGGKQGFKEAQMYPNDYDGIIAGAPAYDWVNLMTQELWIGNAVHKDPDSYIPPAKFPVIRDAVLARCDTQDGVKDGLLEDPRLCRWDPADLQCKSGDAADCLTAKQVEASKKIYAGLKHPRTGAQIFPGLQPGSELQWNGLAGPNVFQTAEGHYKYAVFANPNWDYKTIDFDKDYAKARESDEAVGHLTADNPDLTPFKKHGGKLLQYMGWNDQLIAPTSSINYYENVQKKMGAKEAYEFYRVFMVPGMAHCQGGPGATDEFDKVATLEQWVEKGIAPETIIASHIERPQQPGGGPVPGAAGTVTRTRPLCAYPRIAKWKGTGSTDDAANFACVAQTNAR